MLKVGLAGYGFMGHMHADCWNATGLAQITAVAAIGETRAAEAQASLNAKTYPTVEAMLDAEQLDVVDVCLPTFLHADAAISALAAGVHVLCEKPMARTVDECKRMEQAAANSKGSLMIAHVLRFWPEYMVIKEALDSGRFGAIQWMNARRMSPAPTWSSRGWLLNPAQSGGGVLDLHVHDIDTLQWLGGAPSSVYAAGTISPQGAVDSVLTTLTGLNGGVSAHAQGTLDRPGTFPFNMALTVCCERGTLMLDTLANPSLAFYPVDGPMETPEAPQPSTGSASFASGNLSSLGGYFNEIQYFANCILEGKTPDVVTPEEASSAVAVCLAAEQSVRTGLIQTL